MTAAIAGISIPVTIRQASVDGSGRWLAAGWRDLRRAPAISLAYGGAFVVVSYALSLGLFDIGMGSLVLPLLGSFLLVSPILVVGLYEVSRRIEAGEPLRVGDIARSCGRNLGQIAALGVVLMLFQFVWVLLAIVLFALFFNQNPPPLDRFLEEIVFSARGASFLILGTAIGAVLATIIFTITAVSIPMLMDRPVDVVTAMMVSALAVRRNWQVMVGWAAMIVIVVGVGVATFFLGLAIALPLLAYATWHAYRDLVEPKS
jgi:uncharacterized membrane protein